MPYFNDRKLELVDRGVAALCYASCGLIGLIYVLFSKKNARNAPFFYFHFLQSILLGIMTFLLNWTGSALKHISMGLIGVIFSLMPGGTAAAMIVSTGIDGLLTLMNFAIYLLILYGFAFALLGKYAEIPWLSTLVRKNM